MVNVSQCIRVIKRFQHRLQPHLQRSNIECRVFVQRANSQNIAEL